MDRVAATEAGQHRARLAVQPRPPVCAFCGWTASEYWLRLGDDCKLYDVHGETICSACATPADVGSRQWHGPVAEAPDGR